MHTKLYFKYHKIQNPFYGFFFGYIVVLVVVIILDASSANGCVWAETTKG